MAEKGQEKGTKNKFGGGQMGANENVQTIPNSEKEEEQKRLEEDLRRAEQEAALVREKREAQKRKEAALAKERLEETKRLAQRT